MKNTTQTPAIKIIRLLLTLTLLSAMALFNTAFASSVKQLEGQQIDEILFNIHTYYVDDLQLQNSHFINYNPQQFERLLAKLDSYSKYLDEDELSTLFDNTNGHYNGLGVEVQDIDNQITITNVVNDSPAEKAGILCNDILISINQTPVRELAINQIAQLIKKSQSANVNLTVQRAHNLLSFNVARSKIKLESVTSQLLDSGVGYLAITFFSNHTVREVAQHIKTMQNYTDYSLKGLVVDLRDNPGGILNSAIAVSDLFLQSGTIVTTKGRFYDANQVFYAKHGDIINGAPIIVLINEQSASAAEILAGALKDNNRAKLVGIQSYGKGSVQSLIPLGNGNTALKLTTAKYFTPSGKSIEGVGITPDVMINQTTLSQNNKVVIIKNEQINNTLYSLPDDLTDLYLIKAKQLLSMH